VPVLALGENPDKLQRVEQKLRRELGRQIVDLLDNERALEDLFLNPDGRLWVNLAGRECVEIGRMNPHQAESAMCSIADWRGALISHDRPILETELPIWNSRFTGLMPPVVSAPAFALRQKAERVFRFDDYESAGILTSKQDTRNRLETHEDFLHDIDGMSHRQILEEAIRRRKNIVVSGGTGSGKTTFMNALLDGISVLTPSDRAVVIEDTPELQINCQNSLSLLASVTRYPSLLDCLRTTLRLRPKRIFVGEVRGAEAHALIKAWNTGHPGGVASVHANSAYEALDRLEVLVAEATNAPQQRMIAEAVDVVVSIVSDSRLGRKVREVAVVTGYENGEYKLVFV
jgi:P-type conjugative transfer ATPase TrbB